MEGTLIKILFLLLPFAGSAQMFGSLSNDDYNAFQIITTGVTTTTHRDGLNNLAKDLRVYGLWSKMNAVYPLAGSTSTTQKYNLKDPRDLDAAFRLSFIGSPTNSSTGVDWNGTSQYANTFLTPSTTLSQNSTHISYYSRENVGAATERDMGIQTGSNTHILRLIIKFVDNNTYCENNAGTVVTSGNVVSNTSGYFISSRTGSTNFSVYQNGSSIATTTSTSDSGPAASVFIGAQQGDGGAVDGYSTKECAFASIGSGLTSGEVATMNTIVQRWITKTSR